MASVAKRKWTYKGQEKTAWQVRYIDAGGHRRGETFDRKKDADDFKRKAERELESGTHVARAASVTFAEAAAEYLEAQDRGERNGSVRPATNRKARGHIDNHLSPRFAALRLIDLRPNHVTQMIAELTGAGYATSSIRNVVSILARILAFAKYRQWVKVNVAIEAATWPENRLPKSAPVRTLSQAEAARIYQFFLNPPGWSPHYAAMGRCMVLIAMLGGLRSGEVRGLTWGDIQEGFILVRRQLDERGKLAPTKTGSSVRKVPIPQALLAEVLAYRQHSVESPLDLIFTTKRGKGISNSVLHKLIWRRALAQLEMGADDNGRIVHFHALRHFAASSMLQTLAASDVSPLIGHSNTSTTLRIYAHTLAPDDRGREAMTESLKLLAA